MASLAAGRADERSPTAPARRHVDQLDARRHGSAAVNVEHDDVDMAEIL